MVRTSLEGLNHPELMTIYPMILVPSGAQWFEEVRYGCVILHPISGSVCCTTV